MLIKIFYKVENPSVRFFNKNKKFHRIGGPAVIFIEEVDTLVHYLPKVFLTFRWHYENGKRIFDEN